MGESESDYEDLTDGMSDFLSDDLAEYNRSEAADERNEYLTGEAAGLSDPLHAKLVGVADGSAGPFLSDIDAALDRAQADGTITREQNIELYSRLYNALVVEYEDTDGEGADAP